MSELLYAKLEEEDKINIADKINIVDKLNIADKINITDKSNIEVVLENKIKKEEIDIENYKKTNYNDLEKIRKQIELLNNVHHIEIAKILKNNNIKLTENNNGLFVNLNNIDVNVINEINKYLTFVNIQENNINDVEVIKKDLQKNYFNDKD
jgi:hypothetical protein